MYVGQSSYFFLSIFEFLIKEMVIRYNVPQYSRSVWYSSTQVICFEMGAFKIWYLFTLSSFEMKSFQYRFNEN